MYENTFEEENRLYLDPTVSRDEQMSFIDTYKDIQARNNAQIARENYNLGTPISSNLGGLGGGAGTVWKAQYQRPQTDLAIANLTTAAQQSALNQAMTNYKNLLQNRYNQAKRAAYKRGNGTTSNTPATTDDEPEETPLLPTTDGDGVELQVDHLDDLIKAFGPLGTKNLLQKASEWSKLLSATDLEKLK